MRVCFKEALTYPPVLSGHMAPCLQMPANIKAGKHTSLTGDVTGG